MEEAESSPRKKRKVVPTEPFNQSRPIPFRLSNRGATLSNLDQEPSPYVNMSMSSSIAGPSSSAGSFSSRTTSSTRSDDLDAAEIENNSCTLPQTSISNTAASSSMLSSSPPIQHPVLPLFERILNQRDTLFEVCSWLPAEDLINLYAVSQNFHRIINQELTTLIVGNAKARMPESADVFRFKAYKLLCMFDAVQNMSRDKNHTPRDTPTFRWLRFLEYREATVNSIITQLALKGHRLPRCTSKVIKKIWFLMDIPETKRRIGCIHNPRLWSDADLFLACLFFMKLDMACTNPVLGKGERRIRAMLLAQRTLAVMDKVLKREMMRNQYEMLQMFTEWGVDRATALHGATQLDQVPEFFFGVPTKYIGTLSCENWTPNAPYLMPPDELIFKESIRRGLRLEDKLIDMMLWGNVHPVTRADVYPTNWKGEVQTSFEDEVEKKVERDIALFLSKEEVQCNEVDLNV